MNVHPASQIPLPYNMLGQDAAEHLPHVVARVVGALRRNAWFTPLSYGAQGNWESITTPHCRVCKTLNTSQGVPSPKRPGPVRIAKSSGRRPTPVSAAGSLAMQQPAVTKVGPQTPAATPSQRYPELRCPLANLACR